VLAASLELTRASTIPVETYVRLMYLKHRYGLGYETLCKEVADSFTWRRFCRIGIDGRVPHPSTLMKLTKRLGARLLEELNAELLSLAVERKVLRSRRLRVDTTAVEADIRSPTDSGLCAHAVSRLTRLARRIQAAGLGRGARVRDRRRSVGRRVRAISAVRSFARRELATIDRLTGEIAARVKRSACSQPWRRPWRPRPQATSSSKASLAPSPRTRSAGCARQAA
jgi:transposase, IS5 family